MVMAVVRMAPRHVVLSSADIALYSQVQMSSLCTSSLANSEPDNIGLGHASQARASTQRSYMGRDVMEDSSYLLVLVLLFLVVLIVIHDRVCTQQQMSLARMCWITGKTICLGDGGPPPALNASC